MKTYSKKPAIGSTVTLARTSLCWCSVVGTSFGKAEKLPAGTAFEVLQVLDFADGTWEALVLHPDGHKCYLTEDEVEYE